MAIGNLMQFIFIFFWLFLFATAKPSNRLYAFGEQTPPAISLQMIDEDTEQPISGVVIVVEWERDKFPTIEPSGVTYARYETTTDAKGYCNIPKKHQIFLFSKFRQENFLIVQYSYEIVEMNIHPSFLEVGNSRLLIEYQKESSKGDGVVLRIRMRSLHNLHIQTTDPSALEKGVTFEQWYASLWPSCQTNECEMNEMQDGDVAVQFNYFKWLKHSQTGVDVGQLAAFYSNSKNAFSPQLIDDFKTIWAKD